MRGAALVVLGCAVAACGAPAPAQRAPGYYASPAAWLCLPGRAGDACAAAPDTTVLAADGTRRVAPAPPPPSPPADCFYVYPTVDLSLRAYNHDDFSDRQRIESATRAQAARFGQVCALYVPLYRQVTIGTYLHGGARLQAGLDLAYADVADAFRQYLATSRGRPIVLVGHSQGAEMVKRLLVQFFDDDPALRARLVVALPIGGDLEVPAGARVGGTFQHLPVCSALGETGCIIGFRSVRDGADIAAPTSPLPPGHEAVCVNPGNLADPHAAALLDAVYPRGDHTADVATPFVSYPALYTGRCARGPSGARALAIAEVPGLRPSPADLDRRLYAGKLGTHVLDFQIAQDDLIEIVRRAEAADRADLHSSRTPAP